VSRVFTTLTAAVLVALTCGPSTSAGDPSNEPARASVRNLRLKVSPNRRYFADQDGKPFFYLADTCWLLFQRPDHDEVDEYLRDRVARGFTVIQAYVIRGLGKRHPDGKAHCSKSRRSSITTPPGPTKRSSRTSITSSTGRTSWDRSWAWSRPSHGTSTRLPSRFSTSGTNTTSVSSSASVTGTTRSSGIREGTPFPERTTLGTSRAIESSCWTMRRRGPRP
jgi:hypothetical protein